MIWDPIAVIMTSPWCRGPIIRKAFTRHDILMNNCVNHRLAGSMLFRFFILTKHLIINLNNDNYRDTRSNHDSHLWSLLILRGISICHLRNIFKGYTLSTLHKSALFKFGPHPISRYPGTRQCKPIILYKISILSQISYYLSMRFRSNWPTTSRQLSRHFQDKEVIIW